MMGDFKGLFKNLTEKAIAVTKEATEKADDLSGGLLSKAKVVGEETLHKAKEVSTEAVQKGSAYLEAHKDEIENLTNKGAEIVEGLAVIGGEYVQKKIEKIDGAAEVRKAAELIREKTRGPVPTQESQAPEQETPEPKKIEP